MKMLTRNNIPCWYKLSWDNEKCAIVLYVHKDFIRFTGEISSDSYEVKEFMEDFGFKKFYGGFDKDFGFDESFVFAGEDDDFVKFLINLPTVKKRTDDPCQYCNGSGEDFIGQRCLFCGGEGKEYVYDKGAVYAMSATFSIFSTVSRFLEEETTSSVPQLLTVNTITTKDIHGGALCGEFSIFLCDWLRAHGPSIVSEMIGAMKNAYVKMLGPSYVHDHDFKAHIADNKGWLNVSCPGNACGLNPSWGSDMYYGKGYEFSDHNVDTPMQQLVLIAGLSALSDKVYKDKD